MTVNMRRFESKSVKRINMVTFVCIIITAFMVVLNYVTEGRFAELEVGQIVFTFYRFFPFLLGAACGYIPGTLSFLIIFVHCYIAYGVEAYLVIGYLAIAIIGDLMCRVHLFSNIRRILLSALCLSFISTNLWQFNLRLIEGDPWNTTLNQEIIYLLREFPQYFIAGIILYFLFEILSDKYKIYFLNAYSYTKKYRQIYSGKGLASNYGLFARSVIIFLGMDLIIVIAATIFFIIPSNYLSPYMTAGDAYYMVYVKRIMLLLGVVMPCFLIANFLVQRHLIDPVRNMAIYLERLSCASGDSRQELIDEVYTLRPYLNDEILDLYDSIKDMVIEEESAIDQLKADVNLQNDIKVTKAADEAKSNFLSNMTHEIRTPINAILGMDEMILREGDEPQIHEYAVNIKKAGNSLLSLVNNILDYAKLESGKMEIVNSEYNVHDCFNDVLNNAMQIAAGKGIEFNTFIDNDFPSVLYGDAYKLTYVIKALLDNALKYTETGHIVFSLKYDIGADDEITISVRVADTGIGLKQEDIEKIYVPFERVEESRNRTAAGSGLGITLMSEFLKMMNSHLIVESRYGKGSVFGFEVVQWVVSYEPAEAFNFEEIKEDSETSFIATQAQILVVDDTLVNLTVIKGLLRKYQMQVTVAESGQAALNLMQDNSFDIIFLDHKMPEMDGIETLHEMHKRYDLSGCKVIALTANDNPAIREYYIYEGFDDFLAKPIDSNALEKMIVKYLPEEKIET